MLYHETKDILHVMAFLGHRKIDNTMKYVQLEQALFQDLNDEFVCKVAKNIEEASILIEAGFEYVTEIDGCKLFKKRKTSLIGTKNENLILTEQKAEVEGS